MLRLSEHEVERVAAFAATHALAKYSNVILFECSPASNQSLMNPEKALRISRRIAERRQDTAIIITSNRPFDAPLPSIVDASALSFRENAELSKHCTLLLGCSSGITWLLTSDWAKKIPTIQVLHESPCWYSFASVRYDHQFWGLDTGHILETDRQSDTEIVDLVLRYLTQGGFEGIQDAGFVPSIEQIYDLYTMRSGELDVMRVLQNFIERNRQVSVNRASFYSGLLFYEMRAWIAAVARDSFRSARCVGRVASLVGDEVKSWRGFR